TRTRQGLAEQRIADVDAPPYRTDQLVAAHGPLAMLEQVDQAFERFQGQGDRVVAAAKLARKRIELETWEPVATCRHGRTMRSCDRRAAGWRRRADVGWEPVTLP